MSASRSAHTFWHCAVTGPGAGSSRSSQRCTACTSRVVETRNIRPEAAYRNASEELVITERFTPVDENTLSWEVRFEDPKTWAAPWAIEMPLKREADAAPFEYACHEGNLGLHNILSAARATDAERDGK